MLDKMSFFLIHLIDKDDYNGIINLHNYIDDLFKTGKTIFHNGIVYLHNLLRRY